MMTTNTTANHFTHWLLLTLFSTVALTSLTNLFADEDGSHRDWTTEQRWAISVAAISLFLSFFGAVTHLVLKDFAGNKIELGGVILLLGFWCGGLPTILDRDHGFTMRSFDFGVDRVHNENLFFSSWGALIVSLLLGGEHLAVLLKRTTDPNFKYWAGLSVAGLAIMSDTARIFKDESFCDDFDETEYCKRTVFGLSLGTITFVLAGIATFVPLPTLVEVLTACCFLVCWCCGAAYLTFDTGPATRVGTLYFSTWFALIFSLMIVSPTAFSYIQPYSEINRAFRCQCDGKCKCNCRDNCQCDGKCKCEENCQCNGKCNCKEDCQCDDKCNCKCGHGKESTEGVTENEGNGGVLEKVVPAGDGEGGPKNSGGADAEDEEIES